MGDGSRGQIEGMLGEAWEAGRFLTLPRGERGARRRALSRAVSEGWCVSPMPGVFCGVSRWESLSKTARHLALARSARELHPDWVFCGPTAAVAHGLDVGWSTIGSLHVATSASSWRSPTSAVTFHPIFDREVPIAEVEGVGATCLERTTLDCLRWTSFSLAMGVADSALRVSGLSADDLAGRMLRQGRGLHGLARVESVMRHADARAESGGESIARARMLQLGFVCPELQVTVPPAAPDAHEYRVDYLWQRADGAVIAGELDGTEKRKNPQMTEGKDVEDVLMEERLRESRLTLYNMAVMRFSFGDTKDPKKFAELLDGFGVPRRGSALALPDDVPVVPDWAALRRG